MVWASPSLPLLMGVPAGALLGARWSAQLPPDQALSWDATVVPGLLGAGAAAGARPPPPLPVCHALAPAASGGSRILFDGMAAATARADGEPVVFLVYRESALVRPPDSAHAAAARAAMHAAELRRVEERFFAQAR